MKKSGIIWNVIFGIIVVTALVLALMLRSEEQNKLRCSNVVVNIKSASPYRFVSDSSVKMWIADIPTTQTPLTSVDLHAIEQRLAMESYVDSVEVSADMDGVVYINITQTNPILRIKSESGHDFYIDSSLKILQIEPHCQTNLPIITGNMEFGFPTDYFGALDVENHQREREELKNIVNFVEYVHNDDFLSKLIVQIYLKNQNEIEIIPRIGNQIIVFGGYEDYPRKLDKIKRFYLNSFSHKWWKEANTINVKFNDQVIVQ